MRYVLLLCLCLAAPSPAAPTIEYSSVADALKSLRAKPGVKFRDEKGWTVVDDRTPGFADVWSFTPPGNPAHPSVVKRSVLEKAGALQIGMSVMCEAEKAACEQLVKEFTALNEQAAGVAKEAQPGSAHPRNAEAEAFAVHWLDLVDKGDGKASFDLLTPHYQAEHTRKSWQQALTDNRAALGPLRGRSLVRIIWHVDPPKAPVPGTYATVEFDSVYANTRSHSQSVLLHSLIGEPFKVMRVDSTIVLKTKP